MDFLASLATSSIHWFYQTKDIISPTPLETYTPVGNLIKDLSGSSNVWFKERIDSESTSVSQVDDIPCMTIFNVGEMKKSYLNNNMASPSFFSFRYFAKPLLIHQNSILIQRTKYFKDVTFGASFTTLLDYIQNSEFKTSLDASTQTPIEFAACDVSKLETFGFPKHGISLSPSYKNTFKKTKTITQKKLFNTCSPETELYKVNSFSSRYHSDLQNQDGYFDKNISNHQDYTNNNDTISPLNFTNRHRAKVTSDNVFPYKLPTMLPKNTYYMPRVFFTPCHDTNIKRVRFPNPVLASKSGGDTYSEIPQYKESSAFNNLYLNQSYKNYPFNYIKSRSKKLFFDNKNSFASCYSKAASRHTLKINQSKFKSSSTLLSSSEYNFISTQYPDLNINKSFNKSDYLNSKINSMGKDTITTQTHSTKSLFPSKCSIKQSYNDIISKKSTYPSSDDVVCNRKTSDTSCIDNLLLKMDKHLSWLKTNSNTPYHSELDIPYCCNTKPIASGFNQYPTSYSNNLFESSNSNYSYNSRK